VIRRRTSKEDRQHNGQQKKYKGTNNDLQNTAQKTNDQATRTPLKPEGGHTSMSILSMYDYNVRMLNIGYKIAFSFVIDIA
jgi:hypothetical protein